MSNQSEFIWGNATYVDLAINESHIYSDHKIILLSIDHNYCTLRVENTEMKLDVARRSLPIVIEGIRIFVADNKKVKNLTSDPEHHGLMKKDALICLSDPSLPLLDPEQYIFPISRRDGYNWHMEERSQMFGYYGYASYMTSAYHKSKGEKYYRSHEGIDFNLHDGRGIEKHPLVAIETGTVLSVYESNQDEICITMESESESGIYYIYQHVYIKNCFVKEGQRVFKGDILGFIWGDNKWGHLHFSVVKSTGLQSYDHRYFNLLNHFPQMYELWYGDLKQRSKVWSEGKFTFGHTKWLVENKLRVAVYDDIVGYGWKIEDWCTAAVVDSYTDTSGGLPLQKVMHEGSFAECENPNDYIDFEIAVVNGTYAVSAKVGDMEKPSWQRIHFNDIEAGTFELEVRDYKWTEEIKVKVQNDKLSVRIEFKDRYFRAGISELHFTKIE